MKNRHRVSQVVSKLICSRRFGSITAVYVGIRIAANIAKLPELVRKA